MTWGDTSNDSGQQLLELLKRESGELMLVAPFIKADVLNHLFDILNHNDPISIYTRWYPIEVALGVSDLEVFDLVSERGGTVYLVGDLHAKVYIKGNSCLVGSANLTRRALGLAHPANLEMLVRVEADDPQIGYFIKALREFAIPADEDTCKAVRAAAEAFENDAALLDRVSNHFRSVAGDTLVTYTESPESVHGGWFPSTSEPRRLLDVYGLGNYRVLESTRLAATNDLRALQVPAGLNTGEFVRHVRAMLRQTRLFHILYSSLRSGGEKEAFVRLCQHFGYDPSSEEASELWDTLSEWFLYFFPEHFRTHPRNIEISTRREFD